MKNLESNFTSTNAKLLANLDYLADIQSGKWRPQHAEIGPWEPCNNDCSFCSVKNRDTSKSMTKEQVIDVLDQLKELDCNTISWTGGGEFTLAPYSNEVMEYAKDLGFKQGLITNGTRLDKISPKAYEGLTWMRVSMNTIDFPKNYVALDSIPMNIDLGMSYVVSDKPEFTVDKLLRLRNYMNLSSSKFLRLVPDCSTEQTVTKSKARLVEIVSKIEPNDKIFIQSKERGKPESCLWGYVKPFINQGNVYRCSANPLIEGRFSRKHIMGNADNLAEIWDNIEPFDTKSCGMCFFKPQAELLEQILKEVVHKEFV